MAIERGHVNTRVAHCQLHVYKAVHTLKVSHLGPTQPFTQAASGYDANHMGAAPSQSEKSGSPGL